IVRKVATDGTITTVAGNGIGRYSGDGGPATSAGLNYPTGLAVDSAGNLLIADVDRVRMVEADGTITTAAGNGGHGYSGDGGPAERAHSEMLQWRYHDHRGLRRQLLLRGRRRTRHPRAAQSLSVGRRHGGR